MNSPDPYATRGSLLSRIKDWDDDSSWRTFHDTYWRLIFTTARKAGLSETEAEDVVQETIVAVSRKMHAFKYDPAVCSFRTWLYTLIRRRIADQFRKRAPTVPIPLPGPGDATGTATDPVSLAVDPASLELDAKWEADWELNLLDVALERVKRRVSAAQYQIFDYHVIQLQPVAQVRKALGVSATQVYLAKLRVGRVLKEEIERLRQDPL
jgi:RNA polymerase sigma-70 factor (ECF subfamily)